MPSRKPKNTNLSQFVRERDNVSVSQIVAEAAKKGLKIKPGLIYNVRSGDKKRAANYGRRGAATRTVYKLVKPAAAASGIEAMIRDIVRQEIRAYFTER